MKFTLALGLYIIAGAVMLTACGRTETQESFTKAPDIRQTAPQEPAQPQQPQQKASGHQYSRKELVDRIAHADVRFNNAPKNDPLETVSARQYAVTEALLVITRALDAEGKFRDETTKYQDRFLPDDNTASLSRRLMDSMLGTYSTLALLYTMRFQDDPDKMRALEVVGKDVEAMMQRNDPIIQPLARMSNANYTLLRGILQNIDRNNSLSVMFSRSDSLHRLGQKSALTGEDKYLNGLYRTFEIAQIWVLQLKPDEAGKASQLKLDMSQRLMASETMGEQMAVAVEYLYRAIRLVAMLTLEVMYPANGK